MQKRHENGYKQFMMMYLEIIKTKMYDKSFHFLSTLFVLLLLISISEPVQSQTTETLELKKEEESGLNYLSSIKSKESVNVILIHGFRSNEKDLTGLKSNFPEANFFTLRAPNEHKNGGYTWYDIKFNRDGSRTRDIQQGLESVDQIVLFIKSIRKTYTGKIVLGGFSQGAILSLKLAMIHPEILDGIICFSGMPLEKGMQANPALKDDYKRLKAFYGHGTNDNVLPISDGRKCKAILEYAGIPTEYKEYPIKHQISKTELEDVSQWFLNSFL